MMVHGLPISRGRYVFDVESNGLLDTATVIHCAVMKDVDTLQVHGFRPDQIPAFLKLYRAAKLLIGFNCIKFDCALIEKLHGVTVPQDRVLDLMNLGRLVFSDIKSLDFPKAKASKEYQSKLAAHEADRAHRIEMGLPDIGPSRLKPVPLFPGQFVGRHSLEAWGYRMGGGLKGDYSKDMKALGLDPWASWNPEMHAYMLQDAEVTHDLFRHLETFQASQQSIDLEMRVAWLCAKIERNGWPLDVRAAEQLYMTLVAERESLRTQLVTLFPPWRTRLPDFIPKRPNRTLGYLAGVPVERWKTHEFNPASRDHIADRLIEKYGWKPTEFNEAKKDADGNTVTVGKPVIDDKVLKKLPYPEAQQLARFFMLQKRIGQLGEGAQAWLKVVREGKIHASYTTNGAVTGRATHSYPNIAQVPSLSAEFGRDCRALFNVPRGWKQLGVDQAGLELRCLASFMVAFDGGAYIDIVLNGDIHWENAKALFGLPEDTVRDDNNPDHVRYRGVAKTFIYAFLYGAGDAKLGSIVKKGAAEGKKLRARFLKKFPALERLINYVKNAAKKGWLKGLDGRKLPIRSPHAALNTLLQSAGALICKQWIVDSEDALKAAGLRHGWDGDFVILGWIHDELQIAVRDVDGLVAKVAEIVIGVARDVGRHFPSWKCPTDGSASPMPKKQNKDDPDEVLGPIVGGANWAACH
ncbi:DNA polymerase [Polymorphobacter arshaanensis]|uniref:DNA polymerase I n=1 Tax=Glacieibacterium arshaanense TaxID=2511025 RepID=A0A4Y9ER86_9SPHN|nr:DNA polymerase [Polymorphobacter arshaanensis]TFU06146.1 DNA polymerase [Polymorphobacter arshaanensis]